MSKDKWIDINDQLPNHGEKVLTYTKTGAFSVCVLIDIKKMNEELFELDISEKLFMDELSQYKFCSQEIPGNYLNNVTHWRYLYGPKFIFQ